ncbi:MAG: hypothetical protein JNM57_15515 [Cyclobacteriaceae bacterium]|nr:hypothetical protein [Cyclobacteriaceae bacterium]
MVLLIYGPGLAAGETPLLERTLTITFSQEKIETALKKISAQGGFTFSYSPSILNENQVINTSFVNKTVRQILDQLFSGTVHYKERGQYIILTRATTGTSKKDPRTLSGYVVDEASGERLKNVSVYDPVTLSSAVTNDYGYFEIQIQDPLANVSLVVNKTNYSDTLVAVPTEKMGLLNIPIKIKTDKIASMADSVGKKIIRFWKTTIKRAQYANMENIRDSLHRTTQVSFFPFVGTNHKLSGNITNDYSFNIFGGYSMGTRKLEIGGLFNIDRGDVQYAQMAGIFNLNGGTSRGYQGAGLFNFNLQEARAVQMAGLFNVNGGEASGAQFAGLFNIQPKSFYGAQVAGLFNYAGKKFKGTQVSGLINIGNHVHGSQIGIINFADSISGVPIGFLSFVKHGYHKVEIAADEIFYTNIAIRTGIHAFYTIVTAGARPSTFQQDKLLWTFGYGIGTAPKINSWLFLNIDLTANQVVEGNTFDAVNVLNKLYLGIELQPVRKFAVTLGATLNGYVTDSTHDYPDLFSEYQPTIIYDHTYSNNINLKMWWGAKVGIRFF